MRSVPPARTLGVLGTGWLGAPLAEHLVSQGHRVAGSTTTAGRRAELRSLGVEPYVVDIGRLSGADPAFFRSEVLIITIPLASVDDFRELVAAVESSAITSVLLVSSTSVYPDVDGTIVESDGGESPVNPRVVIERLFQASGHFRTTVARMGGLIGYNRHPGRFFGVGKIMRNPDAAVNLIHRDDCIGIVARIIEQGVWGEVFNCCADTHPTRRDFYTRAANSLGLPAPEFAPSAANARKIISNRKVKQVLKYEFVYPDLMKIAF